MGRTKAILEGIISREIHHRVRFSAQTRVDRVDEEFIRLLKTANFETLELGVESGNAEILRQSKKGITLEQVEYAVGLAKANGLRVWCKFILGHPNETHATIRDTLNFIARTAGRCCGRRAPGRRWNTAGRVSRRLCPERPISVSLQPSPRTATPPRGDS